MNKIVVIAAYPELTILVQELAHQLDIGINVIEAVFEEALTEVSQLVNKTNPEVIVSRGATAELLLTPRCP